MYRGSNAPIALLVSGPFFQDSAGGLTFVEWCLSGLIGDVRLGPSLEQGLEAVQVSPARRQVKGRFLLQGALVDGCRVCWGGERGAFMKEEDTGLLSSTGVVLISSQPQGHACV